MANNTLGDVMGFRLHHSNIASGVLVPSSVFAGPVRGLLLDKGPHEVMHYHYFKCSFSNSLILSTTFSIMRY